MPDGAVGVGDVFEIDADASRYFVYAPSLIEFAAKPLNGEPPFTYAWDFADGSPQAVGPRAQHLFDKVGSYHVFVHGRDKTNAASRVELVITVVSREDWAALKHVDPATLSTSAPSPIPAPTP